MGTNAVRFADRLAEAHQRYWQVLPLNPTNPLNGNSPYFSSSAFAGNPLLIDLETLVETGLLARTDIESPPVFPAGRVDYDMVRRYKRPLLEKAFSRFATLPDRSSFDHFCSRESFWLDNYALYTVLKEQYGKQAWNQWPDKYKYRDADALKDAAQKHAREILMVKFYQYCFFTQWTDFKRYCGTKSIQIIGDLPIYVSYDSADVWVYPDIFKLDTQGDPLVVSGVPPDYFSATGQLWNNPVYDWDTLRRNGYRWWIERMAALLRRFDMVRIDHFRGLVQYWEVGAGETTAINGKWCDVPTYDFFDTMTNHFSPFPVIAEDLGVITDDVREVIRHYGFPGMKVLQFAFGDDSTNPYLPHNLDRNCIVYTGTHDNNTLRGWLEEEVGAAEKKNIIRYLGKKLTGEKTGEAIIRLAMMSVADTALIPLQDYLRLDGSARMNQPARQDGNWVWRCTPEHFDRIPFESIAEMTDAYGRAPERETRENR
jgi:4-alpha-glucanotransferase